MIIYWAAILLDIVSIAVIGVLIGVLAIQEVYSYLKAVKRLFIETFSAFIGINLILLVGRIYPLSSMVAIISDRLVYTLVLFALAVMGCAATIIYKKPKATTLRGTYAEILSERKLALPFLSLMSTTLGLIILSWIVPVRVELAGCYPDLYVPVREIQHLIAYNITLIAFLSYPAALFLLASYAAKNKVVSRDLRIFAICVLGLGLSNYLQAYFVTLCLAEMLEIVQIPCFIALAYVFRRITALQRFKEVELGEYIARLRRRV